MSLQLVNVRIVQEDRIIEGSLEIRDGFVSSIGGATAGQVDVLDCQGDFLLPGLIDLHTDNVEHHMQPRPGVQWPSSLSAVLAHDWQILGSGITTVLDALALGDYDSGGMRTAMLNEAIAGLTQTRAGGLLKADHYFHFRCELSDTALLPIVDRHIDNLALRLVSVMDHTPGQRQWHNLTLYREFRRKKNARVWSEDEFELYIADRLEHQRLHVPPGRATIGSLCSERNIPIASHDDTTFADVEESHADGITISEFPTTVEAARRARECGMKIVMGSPNIILGGSHSGNVSALELADLGLLDVLTSDYVPGSLLHAAFALAARGFDLPEAVAMVTKNPADLLGFTDRGRIAPGLRADLIRVRLVDGVPVIRNVWVAGRQYL
ncbi:amidohydrolase [Mesorhizobium tianshanense]|uniref:Alpha-D-ribose 1-methylphosphonate 5-triphosphate diphosphatase n=1 Tax=Mesorhizobium tianshanense TaxID=39844 RepID=A0A562MRR3_9HYPH|nr:alpha-D-ribose 1-methylphosphonate 5-triphosphate diphosphatase [Mesorhizobium tianshanense]TWI22271.1 alpha-D-ribose 1-methylphosphonate 5-triphosphate diphosphatase [Mesorhizobium tianshanense]GLS36532.1 amidohydrolase [Mesorhizobium tianshanense]